MSTETLMLLIVILLVVGTLPAWPHSRSWGFGPTGILSILLIVFIVWAVAENRPLFRSSPAADIDSAIHEVGHDLKAIGREAADTVRDATN